jgi:hypothetical protein
MLCAEMWFTYHSTTVGKKICTCVPAIQRSSLKETEFRQEMVVFIISGLFNDSSSG